MISRFFLIPAAVIVSAPACAGTWYLTGEQAQSVLFPGASFVEDFRVLSNAQIDDIQSQTGIAVSDRKIRAWRVSTGGWFFVDQVIGQDSSITYAVGLDAKGIVTGIEVMECLALFDQVTLPEWRAQFIGKRRDTMGKHSTIESISGATLSSEHITEGVTRILATFALIFAPS